MRRYPLNRYIVTARRPLPVSLELPNWVELLPLDEYESIDFLIGRRVHESRIGEGPLPNLSRSFGPRVGNPQVLSVARRLWRQGASIPTTLSGLYMAFYQVAGASLSPELREELLPKLALHMSLEDQTLHNPGSPREAGRFQDRSGYRLMGGVLKKPRWMIFLRSSARPVCSARPRAFSFPSLGIQEFLTGLALRSISIEEVLKLVKPAQWTSLTKAGGRPCQLTQRLLSRSRALPERLSRRQLGAHRATHRARSPARIAMLS